LNTPYIFRKRQTVKWSENAFKKLTKRNIKQWYGLNPFKVIKTQRAENRRQTEHPQLVTIECNGICNRPTLSQGSVKPCAGKCLITLSGIFFEPDKNNKRKSRKKKKRRK